MTIKSSDRRVLKRMDSEATMRMVNSEKGFCGVCRVIVERSVSGNLGPPTCKKVRSTNQRTDKTNPGKHHRRVGSTGEISYKEAKKNHRRVGSTGEIHYKEEPEAEAEAGIEPQLVRSGGLRRDWSFENLYQNAKDSKRISRDNKKTTSTTTTTRTSEIAPTHP